MAEPARALARQAAAHGLPTYLYRFSYLRPGQRDGKIPGPLHFDEVYVVFDSLATSPPPVSDDKVATEAMGSRWTAFAKTGARRRAAARFHQRRTGGPQGLRQGEAGRGRGRRRDPGASLRA